MRPEVLNPLFAEIEVLKGVGPQVAKLLKRLDLTRVVDALYHQIVQDTLTQMEGDGDKNEADVNLANIMIAKNLERIGDHCTNIAEDVIFVRLGRIVRHLHAVL